MQHRVRVPLSDRPANHLSGGNRRPWQMDWAVDIAKRALVTGPTRNMVLDTSRVPRHRAGNHWAAKEPAGNERAGATENNFAGEVQATKQVPHRPERFPGDWPARPG